jgi:uncharacterized protein YyaL (SSP411 family)
MATNRLIHEKSPYLLQHAQNPVNWYAWGPEAFEAAVRHNKPIFLSVGYATCHWCHVMERESFEDREVADLLNRHFVAIKVDREERPDIDAVYMAACQLATGSGGWPLTIIMTPDKKPFFAGTYFPKASRFGRPGVMELCRQTAELWRDTPDRVKSSAEELMMHVARLFAFNGGTETRLDPQLIHRTVEQILQGYDSRYGGFDSAPKFPMPHRLLFLLDHHARGEEDARLEMVTHTLTAMRLGGMWDHVGFGFHRYSTDPQWLLPHFEKMLYDQALTAMAYLRAWQRTDRPLFRQTADEIFTYVLRDMTDPLGGFYTAEDADSEGEEGKFYVWSQAEFSRVISQDRYDAPWDRMFNVSAEGNFADEATRRKSGANILHLPRPLADWAAELNRPVAELTEQWEALRAELFAVRVNRVLPLKDDKILTDWNGLMIAALAEGGRVLGQSRLKEAAEKAARFVLERMTDGQNRLLHRYRQGQAAIHATANDYAFLIMGLLALDQAAPGAAWRAHAIDLQRTMTDLFWDRRHGGYFLTAEDQSELPVRPKELYDGAIPSANSVALHNLATLAQTTGDPRWAARAEKLLEAFSESIRRHPAGYTHLISGWERLRRVATD